MAVYNLTDKIPSSGGTITAATWSKDCITNVSTSNVPSWITTGGTANKTLTLYGDSWTGTTERKATITVNYKASGTDCSNSLIVTQTSGDTPTPPTPSPTTGQVAVHYENVGGLSNGPSASLLFAPAPGATGTALNISSASLPSVRNIDWASNLPSSCTLTKVGIDGNGSSTIYVKIVAARHAASTNTTILTSTAVSSTGGQFNLTTTINVDDYRAGDIHFYFSTGPIS